MLRLFEDAHSYFMTLLPELPGDNSMPVEPLQVQSPIFPMENVSRQVHSQDVADEGMIVPIYQ